MRLINNRPIIKLITLSKDLIQVNRASTLLFVIVKVSEKSLDFA